MTTTSTGPDALAVMLAELAAEARRRGHDVSTIAPPSPPPIDLTAAARAALAAPTGSPPLREVATGCRRVVVITSDATRAVPTAELLDALMPELAAAGVSDDDVTVVIATGAHRAATGDEVERLLGLHWSARLRVISNDAHADDLVGYGRTSRGTPVAICAEVAQADLRIALGVVEPHEFAGFSGGRKAILPGVAGYDSILANHAVERLADPLAAPGSMTGNPVHEDMIEAVRLVGPVFILNVTLDELLRPTAVAAGECEAAHAELVSFVRSSVVCRADGVADLLVTGPGAPLDINLYQAAKALCAVQPLVGGHSRVLLVAACVEGVGAEAMVQPFAAAGSAVGALEALRGPGYVVEQNGAYVLAEFLTRPGQVHAWCPGVADRTIETFGMRPAATPSAGLRAALDGFAAGARVLCVPRAQRLLFETPACQQRPVGSGSD